MNYRMHEKIKNKEAIDISKCERMGVWYVLNEFVEDVDYCDLQKEEWVWSIGKRKSDGVYLAAMGTDFNSNPDFVCVWLR